MRVIIFLLFITIFTSFRKADRLKEGYYQVSHGHAAIVYRIKNKRIEWFRDNLSKAWAEGTYKINDGDSVLSIAYGKMWTSTVSKHAEDFHAEVRLTWIESEGVYYLKDYSYQESSESMENLVERVKASCKIRVASN